VIKTRLKVVYTSFRINLECSKNERKTMKHWHREHVTENLLSANFNNMTSFFTTKAETLTEKNDNDHEVASGHDPTIVVNGDVYDGEYKEGIRHGQGVYR
jgi:hypothetical protein